MKRNRTIISLAFLFFIFISIPSIIKAQIYCPASRLDSVLLHLRSVTKKNFAFDNALLSKYKVKGHKVDTSSFSSYLSKLLDPFDLEFIVKQDVYLILPSQKKVLPKSIKGIVRDQQTGESLPFTHIVDIKSKQYYVANQDGYFSILDIKTDSLSLIFSYIGYEEHLYTFEVKDDNDLKVFRLDHKENTIKEATIRAENNSSSPIMLHDQISLNTINPNSISSLPGSGENDVLRLVQMLPGVKATNESSSLIIRGSEMSENLVLFDDFTLYHTDHFFGMTSSLNPKAIKHIQVFKGGFDSRYGTRANGLVNIVGKSGNNQKPSIDAGLNMLSANLAFESPVGKFGEIFIAGRRSYTDLVQTPLYNQMLDNIINNSTVDGIPDDNYYSVESKNSFFYYDLYAKFTSKLSASDNLSISYLTSADNFERNHELNDTDILKNSGVNIRWSRQWNHRIYTKFLISRSDFSNEFKSQESIDLDTAFFSYRTINNAKLNEYCFKLHTSVNLRPNIFLDFGSEYFDQNTGYDQGIDQYGFELENYSYNSSSFLISSYMQLRLDKLKGFSATLGLRANYFDQTSNLNAEPRINLNYSIFDDFLLKFNYGHYSQFISKIFVGNNNYSSRSLWLLAGNNNIPIKKSKQTAVGFSYKLDNVNFDLEYFHKNTTGLVKYVSTLFWDDQSFEDPYYDLNTEFYRGSSKIQGIDFYTSLNLKTFSAWIGYTLSDNKIKFPGLNAGKEFSSLLDQRHEFKIVGIKKIKRFTGSLTWFYGSSFKYDQPYFLIDNELSDKLPAYHKMDINLTYNFNIKSVKGEIGISVLNLYNKNNKRLKESIPYIDDVDTYYDISSIDLSGRTISAFLNIKL